MISKMKLQNGILTLIGFIMLVSICVLVNRLESRKPEIEIRESIEGVNVYNEESKLVDLLQFNYRTNKHYVLTYIIQSFGTEIDVFEYYRKIWKRSDGNLQEKQIILIIQTIER